MRQAQNDLDGHSESNAVLGFAIPTQSAEEHFGAGHTLMNLTQHGQQTKPVSQEL